MTTDELQHIADLTVKMTEQETQIKKLQAFKSWVHTYLDAKGVPHHPPGIHGAEGCRIGDRMDYVWNDLIGSDHSRENLLRQLSALQRDVLEMRDRIRELEEGT